MFMYFIKITSIIISFFYYKTYIKDSTAARAQ